MINTKSDYALNKKDTEAIVYIDAEGGITRLSTDDFSSEEEFRCWKSWSDENYHSIENGNHLFANHTLSLDLLADGSATAPGTDIRLEATQEKARQAILFSYYVAEIKGRLTEIQFRRLWLYLVNDLTEAEIASIEQVGQRRVSSSILSAKRKIKNIFQTP